MANLSLDRERLKEEHASILPCVGNGWADLIIDMLLELKEVDPNIGISSIKEKFGGLRVSISCDDTSTKTDTWDKCWTITAKYENKSCCVCEECGKPGVLRKGGWLKTLCNNHSDGRDPIPPKMDLNHECHIPWNTCPECKTNSCQVCSWACYQCVDAWRHEKCAREHFARTKHSGQINDLQYLLSMTDH